MACKYIYQGREFSTKEEIAQFINRSAIPIEPEPEPTGESLYSALIGKDYNQALS